MKELKPATKAGASPKTRVIFTSDAEIDDECSFVRFLLYANEWDIEGIITTSSQYHWQGHDWGGDDWALPYLDAYAQVYPNLIKHDPNYPTPEYLRARTALGNCKSEGEMEEVTAGSQLLVKVLLDQTDERPIWVQTWGGTNTIARALKTIEEEHPDRIPEVVRKARFFFIWEQDVTYQEYIRPHWEKYGITTIICDMFEAISYRWKQVQPAEMQEYFEAAWMKANILENHGALCSLYKARKNEEPAFNEGDFRSEGDTPAFLHAIPNGLRSLESPDWGGWGGRYVRVRGNVWLDPVPVAGYVHPDGRWCVKPYEEANHPPVVVLAHPADLEAQSGATVKLSARGTTDPDGDELTFRWWQDQDAGTYKGMIEIQNAGNPEASFTVPGEVAKGQTIHVICEVTDNGAPPLTRYQRVVIHC